MMVTNSEINTTNPIGIVSGGTNASSLSTTNGTVYFDGARLATTATGTAGYALTSNGSSAPNYQALPSGGGAWTLIQTQNASSSSSIIFSTTNTYSNYAVIFDAIVPGTASATLGMTWSANGGVSYINLYNSGYYFYTNSSTTPSQSSSATNSYCYVGAPSSATSGIPLSATMYLFSMTQGGSFYPAYYVDCMQVISSNLCWVTSFGQTTSSGVGVTNISFQFSSGNIASGTISLFGISS